MKLLKLLFFCFLALPSFSQWDTFSQNKLVQFEIPQGFQIEESKQGKKYTATENGNSYIFAYTKSYKYSDCQNLNQLDEKYDEIFDIIKASFGNHTIDTIIKTEMHGLRCLKAKAQLDVFGKNKDYECILFAFPDQILSFQKLYLKSDKTTQKRYFESIRFQKEMSFDDQFAIPNNKTFLYLLVFGLISAIIFMVYFKNRKSA